MRFWPMAILLPLSAACSPNSLSLTTPTTAPGALGNGNFSYTCQANDATCREGDQIAPPSEVAVGARFRLAYQSNNDNGTEPPFVVPASSALASAPLYQAGNFEILKPGDCAYLAEEDGNIDDFLNILGAPVDHIQVPPQLSLAAFDQHSVTVNPVDAQDYPLAGSLQYTWSSSDETIASVSGQGPTASITGVAPGHAIVTVGVGGTYNTFSVTVTES